MAKDVREWNYEVTVKLEGEEETLALSGADAHSFYVQLHDESDTKSELITIQSLDGKTGAIKETVIPRSAIISVKTGIETEKHSVADDNCRGEK